jgi:hypothetical protein
MQLVNSEYNFSYYNTLLSAKKPDLEFDINQLIEVIKYGYIKNEVETLRSKKNKAERSKIKQSKLPCVTLSGIFQKRNKDNLKEHSGLMQIDIDDVQDYDAIYRKLISDEYTYVAFKSPSGNGIKLVVKINPSIDTHLEQFLSLQKYYFDEFKIEIDSACKDIARCMLLSYDPNIYCNPFSEVYAELYMPEPKEVPKTNNNANYTVNLNSNSDEEVIQILTLEIENNNIDITNGYENWVRVGFSLASSLGESGRSYFHRISKFNAGYNTNACDKQYTNLLKRNNGAISLGTLIHITRFNGIQVKFPENNKNKTENLVSKNFKLDKHLLFDSLKLKRLELSKKLGTPAYTIFKNKTIEDLVEKLPKSKQELLNVYGISEKNFDKFGDDILSIISKFTQGQSEYEKPTVQKYVIPKLNNQDEELFQKLREFRLNLARKKGLQVFYIYGNATISELVEMKPQTENELLSIKGFGKKKVEQIGDSVLELISIYLN